MLALSHRQLDQSMAHHLISALKPPKSDLSGSSSGTDKALFHD